MAVASDKTKASSHAADIVLATHNARWIHASFGLRSLRANLGALRDRSVWGPYLSFIVLQAEAGRM